MKKILFIITLIFLIFQSVTLAVDIDIGNNTLSGGGGLPALYTYIVRDNPANASGKITNVELYSNTVMTDVEIGIFYVVSGSNFSTRDSETITDVLIGWSYHTVDLDVNEGDYIGIYFTIDSIFYCTSGGEAYWYLSGDNIPCVDTTFTYSGQPTRQMVLYGTGTTAIGWDHKWNTQTISKWNTKEFTKWNGLE